nr:hypothetical protein [Tanacetum cinerariifolium]
MDKVRRDKGKEVHARLDIGEGSRERRTREDSHHSSARARTTRPKILKVRDRFRYGDMHVLDRLGHQRQSAFDRLSETYSPSTTKSIPGRTNSRDHPRGFVTLVTMGVVLAIALILLRVIPSVGFHRWRQLVDTKVRTYLIWPE